MWGIISTVCKHCGGTQRLIPATHRWRSAFSPRAARSLVSTTGTWEPELNEHVRQDIERHWRGRLKERDLQSQFKEDGGDKHYVLSMFPYPSGALHMGHVRVYTISDAMARYHRLMGRNVLHPMGWDAFGLPAENAAIDRGEQPSNWTTKNIENMKQQLEQLSLSFDWDREYATCCPAYYRWTQHIFLKMHEAGLVYQKQAAVNWDPVDQTVLADEQIDDEGRSWRSGAIAEKRLLKQWYIRTTAYSQSLIEGLDEVSPDMWRDVIALQKHWIGTCDGVRLELDLKLDAGACEENLSVFTRTPDLLHGVSHILIAPHHPLNRAPYLPAGSSGTTGCQLEVEAVNPLTGDPIPIYLCTEHDFGDFLDTHLGIPSSEEADATFAERHGLTCLNVLDKDSQGEPVLINSGQFSGLTKKAAYKKVAEHLKSINHGGHVTSERARDWLISRQRYWGTPIPMMNCSECGVVPVPYDDLPVRLPDLEQLTGKGKSPLSQATEWLNAPCPWCGGAAQRETDTMDTFVDSSWYYLRYTDPANTEAPFDKDKAHALMPVDLYIGGKEHAIMHLYYARFFSHFLHDCGLVPTREPFINLLTQGMVMGQSYRLPSGRYLPPTDVDTSGGEAVQRGTGAALTVEWEKMSKSKYNGVDPQDVLEEYGTDSTRLCILSGVAPKTERHWDPNDMVGVLRWQGRVWSLVTALRAQRQEVTSSGSVTSSGGVTSSGSVPEAELQEWEDIIWEARNSTIKEVSWNMSHTFLLNVAISRLHALTKTLTRVPVSVLGVSEQCERAVAELLIMVAPFAPMYTAEMWEGLRGIAQSPHFNWEDDILSQKWPSVDSNYRLHMKVKRGHDDCFEIPLPVTIGNEETLTREDFLDLARSHEDYETSLGDLKADRFNINLQPGYKVIMTYNENKKEMKARKKKEKQLKAKAQTT